MMVQTLAGSSLLSSSSVCTSGLAGQPCRHNQENDTLACPIRLAADELNVDMCFIPRVKLAEHSDNRIDMRALAAEAVPADVSSAMEAR